MIILAAAQAAEAAKVNTTWLVSTLVLAIALILFLILKWRVQAFVALLVASVFVGVFSGTMELTEVGKTIQDSMGGGLGFIATVIGLGAIFGAMIEHSGGAHSLANGLLRIFGEKKATWAMLLTGFLISIPVFLDVALVIIAPILYALARKTGKSLLTFGLPLLAGMVVTHSFVPPTPGPTWVAYEFGVPIGTVILYSVLVGFPTAVIAGIFIGGRIANQVRIDPPELEVTEEKIGPSFGMIVGILLLPVVLIVAGSLVEQSVGAQLSPSFAAEITDAMDKKKAVGAEVARLMSEAPMWQQVVAFFGHPILALLLSTVLTLWLLGAKRGVKKDQLMEVATRSLGPAGIIILITGAGGVFKGMLGKTGVGDALADLLAGFGMIPVLLAFAFSAISRIAQGSATVAMVMAASLMAPLLAGMDLSNAKLSLVVIAIASGAAGFSHVNDSGFWMVSRYFRMTEKETFRTWSVVSTWVGVIGVALASILWFLVP